jgi:hypothetical protein
MSLELDGELSQVERALLAAHTRGCGSCARVRLDFDAITSMVRTSPLEIPEHALSMPVRRRRVSAAQLGAAAALVRLRLDFDAITSMVRTTPLEIPERALTTPLRRRRVSAAQIGAAAALVAVAVGLGSLGASLGRGTEEKKPAQINVALLTHNDGHQFRDMRRGDLVPPAHRFTPPGRLDAV